MKSILLFNYIAVIIYAAILVSIYYRKMFRGIENRTFLRVVWICLTTTLMDIFMGWSYRFIPLFSWGIPLSYFFGYCYFIARQFITFSYLILIFVQTDSIFKLQKRSSRILIGLPVTISCLFILSNFFTHQVFTITREYNYRRGPLMPTLYIYSMLYSVIGFVYLCRMRRYLGQGKWLTMISTYIMALASAVYQFLHPGILVEMLSTSFTILMVHLIIYRPEEMFDSDTGLYNRSAFRRQLDSLMLSGRNATIFIINFANEHEARNYFGDEKFFSFIKRVDKRIQESIGELAGYKLYYHSAGSLQIIFNQGSLDVEKKYPELFSMWSSPLEDSYASILDPKLCLLEFPRDFSTIESMIQFTRFFQRYLKPGQTLLKAEDVIQSKNFKFQENISAIIEQGIENGNFEMYFQPIYDLKLKKFATAEALIRLNDPLYGFISPAMFIPAAESTGLILPIGNFVLDSIFKFVTIPEFSALGLHYIELNLSVEQLLQKDLVDRIKQLQEKYGTPTERINLEITESMAGMHSKTGFNNVEALIKEKYSFSLDDYGIGYSNIKRAIDLPLSLVKIDKSIVDIVETPVGRTIIRNTIKMMHDVGFKIVCEGVETESQYRILDELDCDYIQGFYFARPMQKEAFISFLQEKNR